MLIINKVIAGLLGPLLLLAVCGCAASSMPAATNAQQVIAEKSDPARFPPTRGPVNATVTLSLYEDYQ